ncbi:MAG: hypothetical protein WD875_16425 [Pirellulales bacterium]
MAVLSTTSLVVGCTKQSEPTTSGVTVVQHGTEFDRREALAAEVDDLTSRRFSLRLRREYDRVELARHGLTPIDTEESILKFLRTQSAFDLQKLEDALIGEGQENVVVVPFGRVCNVSVEYE